MGINERKLRDKERRVAEILEAAKGLFLDKGYLHTTMLDIAERSELSRRTIYLYFRSKEEITFAVMVGSFGLLRDKLKEAVKKASTALGQLYRMKEAYFDFYRNHFDDFYSTLYFDLKLNTKNITTEDARTCFNIITEIVQLLSDVLQRGMEDKTLRPIEKVDRTAFTMATIIMSTMQKAAIRKELLEYATDFSEEEIISEMFDLLFLSVKH
ncbi:TetR/AcrR family transcriptional regulator [Sediminispirochaeta smaragdinae]|uniref:Transcriptional regulator, TetR family n=1 Tax=Sediminispirochaeta smaragdinae (strain DSM 11293 / JCM 15392 / SEBR 4228) TaxID=573413 RepID=E1R7V2_SEDSS|nr:TetR/AcrR family transcriptional regulator [Sediminispirochaeta smaragdinae]ADK82807.1 transcriptional regulator, TetR family [Sediminispirochaeta smaragdinae DSM 11293]